VWVRRVLGGHDYMLNGAEQIHPLIQIQALQIPREPFVVLDLLHDDGEILQTATILLSEEEGEEPGDLVLIQVCDRAEVLHEGGGVEWWWWELQDRGMLVTRQTIHQVPAGPGQGPTHLFQSGSIITQK